MTNHKILENKRLTDNIVSAAGFTNFDKPLSVKSLSDYINAALNEIRKSERDAMRSFLSEMSN